MYDMVTLGSATVDLFADTDSELVQIETSHSLEKLIAYPLGGKILVKHLNVTIGGGGTNTAVAFARQGLKTAYLGKLGDDAQGQQVLDELQREGVDFIGARGGQTGLSVILDSIHDDRTILAFKGANDHLSLDEAKLPESRWLYCSAMLGESLDTLKAVVATAQAKVAFNPSSYLARQGIAALQPILDHLEVLVLNKEESAMLLGLDEHEQQDMAELLKALAARLAVPVIAITDGNQGVLATDRVKRVGAKPRANLAIVETTGAGDAFASGLVASLAKGEGLAAAVRGGMCNAESVLAYQGAKNRLLTANELAGALEVDQRELTESRWPG
ncbi:carbohydrate kinase family protein [Gallaecimonas kandeliae]|uniref:carbohydrate kinase family protein n=1 Tax=Gallaecimonas kandeliae TaxID=3029055 RepID=UPI0026470D3F|nr:carbohydrate kinase family protein [Gallaecimonas kandeliae]WKE67080.1 carbohydrate kinase family protein [Gallaecimonas kandeliae]